MLSFGLETTPMTIGARENRAAASGTGRIQAGGVEKDVSFAPVDDAELQREIDAAYHAKYDHYPKEFVDPVVGEHSYDATIRLVPRSTA